MLQLISISFCIHIFLFLAVLNTYFQSIIETDLPSTTSTDNPPAKRILLIIVDGLRAQAILGENENVAPFLKDLRDRNSSWGISYGAAPTESRIGSNAVIGGFREDPRAILYAWSYYPVKYDTVFEQSTNTWCVAGAECIEDIFTRYRTKNMQATYSQ
ncbi:GPI ethanolamine phosphate transferase 1-like isoform X2 [Harmonia axyridis]|uniref:GPI ethanolamine phosphate transferase 1-like isoform X2 n=1 Tax=Harmonia axyridis TaxID=115357 RepID=UPI001E2784FD|nr:GPI ethanolamine phosphate transferase 1-like isoform X2 [Harmonia axyridis]